MESFDVVVAIRRFVHSSVEEVRETLSKIDFHHNVLCDPNCRRVGVIYDLLLLQQQVLGNSTAHDSR